MTRVLVIDDEEAIRSIVRRTLETDGYEVVEARDGVAALQLLEADPVDLVITDLYMPGMDGIEFTIRLGQLPRRPKVLAISGGGYADKGELLEVAQRLGADGTLPKPFSANELLGAVHAILGADSGS